MIGGTDLVFWVGEDVSVTDVIFRALRRYWPDLVFENADDDSPPVNPRAGQGNPQPSGPEFFIYRDEEAARDWEEHGATPDNAGLMVSVILGKRRKPELGLRSITLVVGERTGDVGRFLDDLDVLFRTLSPGGGVDIIDQERPLSSSASGGQP